MLSGGREKVHWNEWFKRKKGKRQFLIFLGNGCKERKNTSPVTTNL